jgi:DNA replicative helicase MCM subunit Mcm2 (Cdc46/Mcm family)
MKNLDLRHNIVFNPLEEHKKEEKLKYDYMGQILDKSLLSRMLPLYIGKDNDRSLKVFDLMLKPNTQEIEKDIFKYRLVIKYLRSRDIIFSNGATNKLKEIFESLIDKHNSETVSMERIGQMLIQLSYAITRINNKTVCGVEEIKYIYDLYLKCLNSVGINLDNLEKLFAEFSVEESFKISEIKRFIELELIIDKKFLTLETIKNKFNEVKEELIIKSIKDLIRDGFIYEFRQGGYKKC